MRGVESHGFWNHFGEERRGLTHRVEQLCIFRGHLHYIHSKRESLIFFFVILQWAKVI